MCYFYFCSLSSVALYIIQLHYAVIFTVVLPPPPLFFTSVSYVSSYAHHPVLHLRNVLV